MKYILIILFVFFYRGYSFSQNIPEDYNFFLSIHRPTDIKWAIPSEILLDSSRQFLVIAYDYNPTFLDLYRVNDFVFLKRIIIKGHVYLDNSYFFLKDSCIYVDYGRNKNKYKKIDFLTFSQQKVECNDVPRGCPYKHIIDSRYEHYDNYTIINNDWYLLKYNKFETQIYLK